MTPGCECYINLTSWRALAWWKKRRASFRWPFKGYVTPWGGGGVRYEGVRFNVISVTRGWVGVKFPDKSVTQHLNGP